MNHDQTLSDGSPVLQSHSQSLSMTLRNYFATHDNMSKEQSMAAGLCSLNALEQLLPINNNQYKRMPTMKYWPLIFLSALVININHISASLLRRQLQEETTSKPLPNVDYELTLHPGHGGCSRVQKPTLDSK